MSEAQQRLFYDPTVFNVPDEASAKRIILTPEAGMTPEERWERETPDIMARIARAIMPGLQEDDPLDLTGQRFLDWGCGIGRIAKPLCQAGALVTGADISDSMRRLAGRYVASTDFEAVHPVELALEEAGSFDFCVAIWSLQHSARLDQDIGQIHRLLQPGGKLVLVNMRTRALPMMGAGWVDDGRDILAALTQRGFTQVEIEPLPPPLYQPGAFWGVFQR